NTIDIDRLRPIPTMKSFVHSFALATGDRSHFLLRVGNRDRLTGPGRGRAPVHLERDADRDRVGSMTQKRIPSAVDAVAEHYVDYMLTLSPSRHHYLGLDVATDFAPFSPAGLSALNDLTVDTLSRLDEAAAGTELDEVDHVTVDAMRDRLGVD